MSVSLDESELPTNARSLFQLVLQEITTLRKIEKQIRCRRFDNLVVATVRKLSLLNDLTDLGWRESRIARRVDVMAVCPTSSLPMSSSCYC